MRSHRSRGRRARALLVSAGLAVGATAPGLARAADGDADAARALAEVGAVSRETGAIQAAITRAKGERYTAEQRLTNGELLYRTGDYARAALVFSELLEEFPDTPSYVDALWLRGETFYAEREYLSARRDYQQIVDRGAEARFGGYFGRALARLVDVSLRTDDLSGLDAIVASLERVPPAHRDAGIHYASGKAYYFRGDYAKAAAALAAVPATGAYAHQARYFEGLVALKHARPAAAQPSAPAPAGPPGAAPRARRVDYKPAIDAFKAAADLPPDTPERRHVVDLAWMAIGRLHYEAENYSQAAEAYSRIGRESPEFGAMLYELAWVYVRLGDVQRAERALEILHVAEPSSATAGDATLLRADLLLRVGAFDKSLELYLAIRDEYEPMRTKIEAFLAEAHDPAVYYEKLSQQQLDLLDQRDELPKLAVRWAREAEDGPKAFAVIDDVNQCKDLIRESYALVEKLTIIVNAANRVRAFPELQAGQEKALSLINRLSRMRAQLARGLDDEEPKELSGEVGEVRARRRAMQRAMAMLPVSSADFAEREQEGMRQWNQLSQELTRRGVEIDYLGATINGLRRMMNDGAEPGAPRDTAAIARLEAELDDHERLLKQRQREAAELRRQIDIGRAQIGLGDASYQSDAVTRVGFRDALEREVTLAMQGHAGASAQRYASRVHRALEEAGAVEDQLVAQFAELERQVASKVREVEAKIEAERVKIDAYNMQLGALEREAHTLVGEVAQRNFRFVRDKLRGIVLRADVGITEQAWEVREEQLERVYNLQSERAREEHLLEEELREVLDDGGDTSAGASP